MKCGARVAAGVAGGYFLGRTKKMKLALMLAGLVAGRRAGGPAELLGRGAKLLESSPELSALREQLQGRLLEAGREAVLSVATRQVESLTERVSQGLEQRVGPARVRDAGERVRDRVVPRSEDGAGDDEPAEEAADSGRETDTGGRQPERPRRPDRPTRESAGRSGSEGSEGGGRSATGRVAASGRRAAGAGGGVARSGARAVGGRPRRTTRGDQ